MDKSPAQSQSSISQIPNSNAEPDGVENVIAKIAQPRISTVDLQHEIHSVSLPIITASEQSSECIGFQTAAHKLVKISADALAKGSKLVEECENVPANQENASVLAENEVCDFKGFQAANYKHLNIAASCMAKPVELVQKCETEGATGSNPNHNIPVNNNESGGFQGFQTASHKSLKISSTALAKAAKLIEDNESVGKCNMRNIAPDQTNHVSGFQGFHTASHKSIQISVGATAKASKLVEDFNSEIDIITSKEKVDINSNTNRTNGGNLIELKTTSNENLKVSENAVDRAKQFAEEFVKHKDQINLSNKVSQIGGFQCASGKNVHISAKRKATSFMRDIEAVVIGDSHSSITQSSRGGLVDNHDNMNEQNFEGFQCASGKSIQLSEEAQQKAEKLMKEIDSEIPIPKQSTGKNPVSKPLDDDLGKFVGFQSASGKKIRMSVEAQEKANKLMKEIAAEINDDNGGSGFNASAHAGSEVVEFMMQQIGKVKTVEKVKEAGKMIKTTRSVPVVNKVPEKIDPMSLPKGFRPFKPPRMSVGATSTSVNVIMKGNNNLATEDKAEPAGSRLKGEKSGSKLNYEGQAKSVTTEKKLDVSADVEDVYEALFDSFNDGNDCNEEKHANSFTYSQLTEITDGTNAYLQTADTFSQFLTSPTVVRDRANLNKQIAKKIATHNLKLEGAGKSDLGFSTASGKSINISEDSIKKATTLVADTDFVECRLSKECKPNIPLMSINSDAEDITDQYLPHESYVTSFLVASAFHTASDKKIEVSKTALEKDTVIITAAEEGNAPDINQATSVRETLHKLNETPSSNISLPLLDREGIISLEHRNTSTSTKDVTDQSGSQIDLAEDSFWKNDNIDQLLTHSTCSRPGSNNVEISGGEDTSRIDVSFQDFQTASGHKVHVSESSLAKAHSVLAEAETKSSFNVGNQLQVYNSIKADPSASTCGYVGFQTASAKKTTVSVQSLQKARKCFETSSENDCDRIWIANSSPVPFEGSEFAKNRQVGVSTSSQSLARQDLGDNTEDSDVSPSSFIGFQTAAGKKVNVSEHSLSRARTVLNDGSELSSKINTGCMDDGDSVVPSVSPVRSVFTEPNIDESLSNEGNKGIQFGFQSASGHNVTVSDEALREAKGMLAKCEGESGTSLTVFQPASGETVVVCKEVLEQARRILYNDGSSVVASEKENMDQEYLVPTFDQPNRPAFGCQTATGSKILISEDFHRKANKVIDDQTNLMHGGGDGLQTTVGFQTASGHKVKISGTALKEAQSLLESDAETYKNMPSAMVCFQTASGSNVKISDTALKQARSLLESESETSSIKLPSASGNKVKLFESTLSEARSPWESKSEIFSKNSSNASLAFQTASGSNVSVSEKNMKKAKRLLDDGEPVGTFGFQTASGITVGETAMEQDKHILGEDVAKNETSGFVHKPTLGFQTASGSKVTISTSSLKKAKQLFDEESCHPEESYISIDATGQPTHGFQTASGSKVTVSQSALKKAKQMFHGDNDCLEDSSHKNSDVTPKLALGFQTASGSKVTVSQSALNKVKQYFDDDRDSFHKNSDIEPKPSVGFQTSSGSLVTISESTKQKAKHQSDSLADSKRIFNATNIPKPPAGFQTASGSKVNVSAQALVEVRQQKNSGDGVSFEADSTLPFQGFQTAQGRTVNVSQSALEQTKAFFAKESGMQSKSEASPLQLVPRGNSPAPPECTPSTDVDISFEASESVKALMADGAFDDLMSPTQTPGGKPRKYHHRTSTPICSDQRSRITQQGIKTIQMNAI